MITVKQRLDTYLLETYSDYAMEAFDLTKDQWHVYDRKDQLSMVRQYLKDSNNKSDWLDLLEDISLEMFNQGMDNALTIIKNIRA